MIDYLTEAKRAKCSKNGGVAPGVFRVDGLNLNYAEIAKILGVTESCARSRMQTLRGASGAITIDRLRALGRRK